MRWGARRKALHQSKIFSIIPQVWEIDIGLSHEVSDNANESIVITDKENDPVKTRIKYLYNLYGHNAAANIVRFSPNGKYLASAGDDQTVIIWALKKRPLEFGVAEEKIIWSVHKLLRGHAGDIYDLSWSPDSSHLISGSVDNSCIIWNIEKGKGVISLKDHKHFVQGVSWDPRNDLLVSQSTDKTLNFYSIVRATNEKVDLKVKSLAKVKGYCPVKKEDFNDYDVGAFDKPVKNVMINFFAGENQFPSFFRRLCWSPDGDFCLTTAGLHQQQGSNKSDYGIWGFLRKDLVNPSFFLPTLTPAVCVRFCPVIFEKSQDPTGKELLKLDYNLIFAIGTIDSILIYCTQSTTPILIACNVHVMTITDLTWKGCELLCGSSSDGYISFIYFDHNQFGKEAGIDQMPEHLKTNYTELKSITYENAITNLDSKTLTPAIKKSVKLTVESENDIKQYKEAKDDQSMMQLDNENDMQVFEEFEHNDEDKVMANIQETKVVETEVKAKKRITPQML